MGQKLRFITKSMVVKLTSLVGILILLFMILFIRICMINVSKGDNYTIEVLKQQEEKSNTIPYKRGEILDRNGVTLAVSIKQYNIILEPKIILSNEKYIDATINAIVTCFGYDKADLLDKINSNKDSYYLIYKKKLTYEQIEGFQALLNDTENNPNIKGIWFETAYERKYPYSSLACTVIGFSSADNIGNTGLEGYYNDILNGTDGREYGYVNNDNVMESVIETAQDGNTIVSTIDYNIQQIVEKYIAEYKTEYNPENIAVVIANPNNGEILAMANDVRYDLNNPRDLSKFFTTQEIEAMDDETIIKNLNELWSNYCVTKNYEPGSTIKPFTVGAALEEAVVEKETEFICDGYEIVGGWKVKCQNVYGHGPMDLTGVIVNSCNDCIMQISALIGPELFCKYQELYGFGKKTGIDLQGEESGITYKADDMAEADLATNGFGQNFTVTMSQMIAGFSSLINGGNYYQVHTVKQILNANGGVVENIGKKLLKKTVSTETSEFLRNAMYDSVTKGSSFAAKVKGYTVAGKTGTAEVYPRGGGNYLLSFMGFAPYDTPQVLCYVIVDRPDVEGTPTSWYAMSLFSKIMTEVLPYLNIYPDSSADNIIEDTSNIDKEDSYEHGIFEAIDN